MSAPSPAASKKDSSPKNAHSARVIYCYTAPNSTDHIGLVKIGDATFGVPPGASRTDIERLSVEAARHRIKQQVGTAGMATVLEWTLVVAKFSIRDYRVHSHLENEHNIDRVSPGGTTAKEWFRTTPDFAKDVALDVIQGSPGASLKDLVAFSFREEQDLFIENTFDAWMARQHERLWNAKMRFGKTSTAFEFIARCRAKALDAFGNTPSRMTRVLIITHRPVVNSGWADEFKLIMTGLHGDQGWQYTSKHPDHMSLSEIDMDRPFICFVSMQDLRGKGGSGFKESNAEIFGLEWDLVLVDEAHEGNSTVLADEVHEALTRGFTLYLSGTPYKYLSNNRFTEDQIDSWDYVMEQEARQTWESKHPGVPNPYEELPRMWIHAVDMSESLQASYGHSAGEIAFDFAEMFRYDKSSAKFQHEADILSFLDAITAPENEDQIRMPYPSGSESFARHALWVLPSVDACRALKALLEAHSYFKDFHVENVAGSGDNAKAASAVLKRVLTAIGDNPGVTRTITLTVGRLTTGTTVKPWTTALMLSNTESAEAYMQTIFRVQSPHEHNGIVKTECFVYDFAPDRVLTVLTEVTGVTAKAGGLNSSGAQSALGELLNYMPVISNIGMSDFRRFDAGDVTQALKRIYRERVLEEGFDSSLLFVKNLEVLPDDIRTTLEEVRIVSGKVAPSTRNKIDNKVVIAKNDLDNKSYEDLKAEVEELAARPAKELSQQDKQALEARRTELKVRENMRNILRTISVRIPSMVIALMAPGLGGVEWLKTSFTLSHFVAAFDAESWKEFFQDVTKEMVLRLEPAFDVEVLQIAVKGWIEEIQAAYALRDTGRYSQYWTALSALMARIKNPNKETVLTPGPVVELQYKAAGLGPGTCWDNQLSSPPKPGQTVQPTSEVTTFYDINVKSGLYSLYAAVNLAEANPTWTWAAVCRAAVYANARTLAGKWITASVLGMPHDWVNITVLDVHAELDSPDIADLTEQQRQAYVGYLLTVALRAVKAGRDITHTDIHVMAEERNRAREIATGKLAPTAIDSVQFDRVISNPPYQLADENNRTKSHPIWQHFVWVANKIGKKIAIINPGRWRNGGSGTGLHPIKDWLLSNTHLESVFVLPSEEVFPTATIRGGVTIEIIDNTREFEHARSGSWSKAEGWSAMSALRITDEIDIPLADDDFRIVSDILREYGDSVESHLWQGGKANLTKQATSGDAGKSASDRYGIRPMRMQRDQQYFVPQLEKKSGVDYIKIWFLGEGKKLEVRYLPASEMQDTENNRLRIPAYKVLISKTEAQAIYRNFGPIGEPQTLCTETWLCRSFESELEVKNYQSYAKTYFYRYLLSLRRATQHAFPHVHRFVPDLVGVLNPRTGKVGYASDWTDDDLVQIFDGILTPQDWCHIKRAAVAADGGRGNYEAGWTFPDGSSHSSLTVVDCSASSDLKTDTDDEAA